MFTMPFPASPPSAQADPLRLHAIFDSGMVLWRGKPITIWGWAGPNATVSVDPGKAKANAEGAADKGRWQATFHARQTSADPQSITVTAGGETVELGNIVVGEVWVMHPDLPIPEFWTDSWDLPEYEDLIVKSLIREFSKPWGDVGKARLEYRRDEEVRRTLEIIERFNTLGSPRP